MKNLQILLVLITVTLGLSAQSPANNLFDKYAGKDGFTTVYISEYMLNLLSNIDAKDSDSKEMEDVINKLKGIKILTSDSSNTSINFLNEMKGSKYWKEYKELMIIKESDQDVQFLVREEGKTISELLLVVSGKGENVLISILGNIDLKTIGKLSKTLNIDGMNKLEKIEE